MVEMALALPIVLMLMFAVIDGGRAVALNNALSEVARDGARYEAVHGVNDTTGNCDATLVSQTQLQAVALASFQPYAGLITVTVADACATDSYGTSYTILATATFQPLTAVVFGKTLSLMATSKMYVYTP